jgi:hypothetical protein
MHDILNEITAQGLNRDGARAARKSRQEGKKAQESESKTEPYVYTYKPKNGEYVLELKFRRSGVERKQVIEALRNTLEILSETDGGGSDNF